ncbi:MAG: 4Fe-4S binding protein [Oscillospiraceae bacterium]|jgi:ferredoxin|nr:4Fe-4S binding protein [Oscillospiraceae bacterium]
MAYKINSDCVSCAACSSQCPVDAIFQGAAQYEIDPGKCVDCGSCAGVCPMSAINAD